MNVKKILAVAQVVEELEHATTITHAGILHFCMADYTFDCGSPACIAGWTVALEICDWKVKDAAVFDLWTFSGRQLGEEELFHTDWIHGEAARILELGEAEAQELFAPKHFWSLGHNLGPGRSARVLRHLAETRTVDWFVAISPRG